MSAAPRAGPRPASQQRTGPMLGCQPLTTSGHMLLAFVARCRALMQPPRDGTELGLCVVPWLSEQAGDLARLRAVCRGCRKGVHSLLGGRRLSERPWSSRLEQAFVRWVGAWLDRAQDAAAEARIQARLDAWWITVVKVQRMQQGWGTPLHCCCTPLHCMLHVNARNCISCCTHAARNCIPCCTPLHRMQHAYCT